MADIEGLIAEARRPQGAFALANLVPELADALERQYERAEWLDNELEQAVGWARIGRAHREKVEAQRDRYRAEAESARKTGERILADALRYRAAIQDAYNAWHMETRGTAIDILARALNENGEN